jgi:spermidine/putrescine transport system ATP-binding protein
VSAAFTSGDAGASAAEPTPEIRLVELTKRFGSLAAVDAISLDIRSGEFFSLLGPSGCGKTTTLRMIGGFELPTSGRIELRGRDITDDPPERRPVNMVFQSYALFPHLRVFDNVAFGLRRRHVADADVRQRVGAALELVRLTGYDRRRPDQLSGGQQQRIALARALVCEPTVLLLDEPLGALDLKLRRQLQVELKRVQLEVGITFVYVTHDQEEALALSDRIAVMNRGHVEQLGTPEELYDRPRTRFVADFIGTTNLVAGTIEARDGDQARVRMSSGETCAVPGDSFAAGDAVELVIRPEALTIEHAGEAGAADSAEGAAGPAPLSAVIRQSAYLGTSVSHQLRTAGGLDLTVVVPRSTGRYVAGDRVTVTWAPGSVLLLRRDTTQATQGKQERETQEE